jgi:hypothetical protein
MARPVSATLEHRRRSDRVHRPPGCIPAGPVTRSRDKDRIARAMVGTRTAIYGRRRPHKPAYWDAHRKPAAPMPTGRVELGNLTGATGGHIATAQLGTTTASEENHMAELAGPVVTGSADARNRHGYMVMLVDHRAWHEAGISWSENRPTVSRRPASAPARWWRPPRPAPAAAARAAAARSPPRPRRPGARPPPGAARR